MYSIKLLALKLPSDQNYGSNTLSTWYPSGLHHRSYLTFASRWCHFRWFRGMHLCLCNAADLVTCLMIIFIPVKLGVSCVFQLSLSRCVSIVPFTLWLVPILTLALTLTYRFYLFFTYSCVYCSSSHFSKIRVIYYQIIVTGPLLLLQWVFTEISWRVYR